MNNNLQTTITKELLIQALKEQFESFQKKELGITREKLDQIKASILSSQVTVITGLRRVGKSTFLRQIVHKYLKVDSYYFVNFEDERLLNFRVQNFNLLHENLISLYGEKKIFILDEIQNIPDWERFVRRLHDSGFKFILTGSNASLLSQELGTRLTGRSIREEIFPFSFREFLIFKKQTIPDLNIPTTSEKGKLLKLTREYLLSGGIPDALKYPKLEIHKTLYDDVLYRDIATRYQIENIKNLKELTFYLVSNTSNLISFNKLKELLKIGSVNTVKNYIDYLENSWLFFIVSKFAYSIKEQQIASKKIYSIDTGLTHSVGFSFSANNGKLIENIVFLQLRKIYGDVFYYKTQQNHEVDFYIPKSGLLFQVSQNLDNPDTKEREIRSLIEAAKETNTKKLYIITESEKKIIRKDSFRIKIIPLYEWLLN